MLKTFIKEVVLGKTEILFSRNFLGRTLRNKGLDLASRELNIPLDMQPDPMDCDFWFIRIGEPGADLFLSLRARQESLVELIDFAARAWLEKRKVRGEEILAILGRHMKGKN